MRRLGSDPAKLVFIDETWAKTTMSRLRGRSIRGRHLVAKIPHGQSFRSELNPIIPPVLRKFASQLGYASVVPTLLNTINCRPLEAQEPVLLSLRRLNIAY